MYACVVCGSIFAWYTSFGCMPVSVSCSFLGFELCVNCACAREPVQDVHVNAMHCVPETSVSVPIECALVLLYKIKETHHMV